MMKVEWINVIIFVLKRMDAYTALHLLEYFYPKTEQHVSPEALTERWGVLEEAANEVGVIEIYRIQKKVLHAYNKVGEGKVLSEDVTYEVVVEALQKSKDVAKDTSTFNRYIQAVVEKAIQK